MMRHYLEEELYSLIKKDEQIFKFIQEGSLDGLWYWDLEKPENEWMNVRFWTTLGYDPAEMPHLSSAWQNIVNQEDLKIAFENVKKHLENPKYLYDQEVRYTHKNGSTVWIRCRGIAIRDENGKAIRMVGAHHDITDIKNKEHEAGLLAEMLDIAPNSITIHDNSGKFLYANQKTFEIHGYTREEFMNLNLPQLDVPASASLIEQRIQEIRQNGHATFEVEHFIKDGSKISLEVFVKLVNWKGTQAMLSIATDIRERKKMMSDLLIAKKNAEQSNQFYKVTFEEAAVGIAHVYPDGKLYKVNHKFCEITGYTEGELTNMNFADITHLEDLNVENKFIQKVLAKEIDTFTIEKRYKHKEGHYIWILLHSNVIRNEKGDVLFAICSISDISIRKKLHIDLLNSKEKLQESEAKLKLALKVAKIGYWRHEIATNKVDWSDGHENLFGITKEQFSNTLDSVQSFVHPDDRAYGEEILKKAIENDMPFDNTYRVVYPNNEIHWLHSLGIIIKNEENRKTYIFGVNQDITEQIMHENELKTAKEKAEQANRLKTEFLNNMSHEIRTPMNGILGFSEMLDEPDLSEEKRKYFTKIVQNSSIQLLKVIDDILEISYHETKQLKVNESSFFMNDLLMDLFSIFSLKSKERNIPIYIRKALHDQDSQLISDKKVLNKILSNLLENAMKYTNEGFIEMGYDIDDDKVILYVKDTGIGIAPNNHEIIFERFSQEEKELSRNYGGLGLGLAIAKENAQLLGGTITLESEKGKGSTFFVTIPYKPLKKSTKEKVFENNEKEKLKDNLTILVAEDEEVNFLFIEAIFEELANVSYTIIHARNGKEAVDFCKENNNIDIVLMDIKMPIMNGYEALEKIRVFSPSLPIIAQTAYSSELEREMAIKKGFNDFISKPLDKEKLFALMIRCLS